jgi:hypothetical protein
MLVRFALSLLALSACSPSRAPKSPIPAEWSHFRPSTPLPVFADLLGTHCEEDFGVIPIVLCGEGQRASIVSFRSWAAVVGEPDDEPYTQHLPVFSYPPIALASSKRFGYQHLDLYADGPYLWLKVFGDGFASLVIVDRRLFSAANRAWLSDWLKLRAGESVYRDADLRAAVLRGK